MKRLLSGPVLSIASSLCLFFIVVGVHWATVDRFGSDMPNWDQWDGEGLHLLAPWFEHDHFINHLFQPHNEHRIVVTKLQNLALTLLDGQWDARLECVANAALHAALAVAFWLAGRRWVGQRWHAPLFIALAALFAAPVAWQNVLGGFHSQQYWLLLFSFGAIVSLPFARAWSVDWYVSATMAALALLTMGSGFLAAAIVFGLCLFRLVRRETTLRAVRPALGLSLALVIVGVLTRVEVSPHEMLKAKTANDFFLSILHSLQWPAPRDFGWLAAVLWLPWLHLAWRAATRSPTRGELTVVALGTWVLVQILATAYARGVGGDFPASRYMDTLAFGAAVNALALSWLLPSEAEPATLNAHGRWWISGSAFARFCFGAAWLAVLAWGIYDLSNLAIAIEMPDVKRSNAEAEAHMRGYLATNDPAQLAFDDIPYPNAGSLIERLDHASLRALLPAKVRPALPMKPASADDVFVENEASQLHLGLAPHRGLSSDCPPLATLPTWGSFGANGVAMTGEWTSAPLSARSGGWLVFETAGDVGRGGVTLELHDAQSHAVLAMVYPTKVPGDAWRAAYVRAPRVPFVVVARDKSPAQWLAFSAPVEMATFSYLAWRCAKNGALVAEVAAVAAVLLGLIVLVGRSAGGTFKA